ncbi:MAG: DUF4340 domain-containing protein, partial [Synergistaceae bacterium]|nr:DUF4340 domain-containing protein [Synergistaceae bacterium]
NRIDITDVSNERELRLVLTEGEWSLNGEEVLTRNRVASLLAVLSYLKALREIDVSYPSVLGILGLSEPRKILRVGYSDGGGDVWSIGSDLGRAGTSIMGESGKVYMIDELRGNVLSTAAETLLESPLRQVDFSRINGVLIQSRSNGEIRLNRSESPRGGGDFFWRIFTPYFCNAKKSAIDKIIEIVADEGWVRRADNKEFSGSSARDTLTLYDAYDRELVLGFAGSLGGRAYCTVEGLPGVYTIGGDVLSVFDIAPESFVDTALYYYEPLSVREFRFFWEGREHYFVSVWEETGEEGKLGQRFIMDGRALSGAGYHEFTRELSGISGSGLYSGREDELGREMGSMFIRRISPPYEQTIKFREIKNMPGYVGVEYDGKTLTCLEAGRLEDLMDLSDSMSAAERVSR